VLRTLKGRTALAAAVLAAIGIALVTSLQSSLSERMVLASSVTHHEEYTNRVAADLDRQFRLARAALSELTGNITGQHMDDPAALHYFLTWRIGIQHNFESIAVFDLRGRLIASRPSMAMAPVAGERWFAETLQDNGTPVIHAPFISPLSGEPVVALTYPLHDENGRLRGVVVGTIALNHDQLLLSHSVGTPHGNFIVVSRAGTVILHPDARYIAQEVDSLGEPAETIRAGMADPAAVRVGPNYNRVRSLYAFRPIASTDWMLIGFASNEEAFASLSRLSRHMLLAGAALAALLFPAMWLLVSRMLQPLDYLRREMRKLRSDPAAALTQVEISGSSELRELAEDFAQMAAAWRTAESALQQEKERAEVTLQSIADGVIATAADGRIAAMNGAAARIVGWPAEEAIGQPFEAVFQIQDETTGAALPDLVQTVMRQGQVSSSTHTVLRTRAGILVPVDASAAPIHTAQGRIDGAVVVFRDVTAVRAAAQQLEWRATHDLMTGLANRAAYEQELERLYASRAQDGPHALVMLDLDEFKAVNDSCGHAAGDELLKQLASLLQNCARKSDMVARLGGDEFAVLMRSCSGENAMRLAEDVRRAITNFRFNWNGRTFRVSASIGVVEIHETLQSADEVQKAADLACYMAKRGGRNRIVRHSDADGSLDVLRAERAAVSTLRSAIDDGRLRLYAQPIVPVRRKKRSMRHFEVLLRMIDADGAPIASGAFLTAAERYGLIDELDRWVIARTAAVCAQRYAPDRWGELGTISINLSPATLRDPHIAEYILEQFDRHGVPYEKVCFEITETAAIDDPEHTGGLMRTLRAKGLRFALDDFGVGMTTLSLLRELPIDILKIDGAFIAGIHKDDVNRSVVEAIQMIARRLGIRTVAERVEQMNELATLCQLGVDYVQGFLLAHPQPIEYVLDSDSVHMQALEIMRDWCRAISPQPLR